MPVVFLANQRALKLRLATEGLGGRGREPIKLVGKPV